MPKSSSQSKAFARAIKVAGGRPRDLLRAINDSDLGVTVHPQHIHNWKKRGVSDAAAIWIETVTGGKVTRAELRPEAGTGNGAKASVG